MNKKYEALPYKGEWTPEILEEYFYHIDRIAKEEFNFDLYPNQVEIITSNQMIDAYSTHAMPVMYYHWKFGKSFTNTYNAYEKGYQNLAFEVVTNTNPCIAYIMEENSIMMQALVYAHASIGHNFVFKNNYMFRDWTDASFIIDYLIFARNYIKKCEEKYGVHQVEDFLDSCHALELYGVDRYKKPNKDTMHLEAMRLKSIEFLEENYDDVIQSTIPKKKEKLLSLDEFDKKYNSIQEENLLYYLEKNTPNLETWKKEILRIVRKISQYFYPQRQTSLINEAAATYVHYKIIHKMYEQGLVSEGFMLEFYESHCSVVNQVNYDHPYYGQIGINVYSLGFNMFRDIERICMEPTDEDKEYFPHWAGNGDWLGTFKHVVKNYRDESFIRQYLSPKLIRDYKFFSVYNNPASPNMYITAIHNKRGYEDIKESLANMFDLSEKLPDIQVNKVNPKTRKLFLKHTSNESKILEPKNTKEVLLHLVNIWKFDVQLDSYDADGKIYNTFDTEKFDR